MAKEDVTFEDLLSLAGKLKAATTISEWKGVGRAFAVENGLSDPEAINLMHVTRELDKKEGEINKLLKKNKLTRS